MVPRCRGGGGDVYVCVCVCVGGGWSCWGKGGVCVSRDTFELQ